MKHFIKKITVCIILTIIAAITVVLALTFSSSNLLVVLSVVFLVFCVFAVFFEIRDYQFYRKLSLKMQGKTLEEKLDILNRYEECWLSYASPEEVKQFRDAAKKCPNNKFLEYLLDRASMYGK